MVRVSKPAAQRKDEILDAAQTLFVTKGYQATTIEDILKAVGIAKGTLYHHFPARRRSSEAWSDARSARRSNARGR